VGIVDIFYIIDIYKAVKCILVYDIYLIKISQGSLDTVNTVIYTYNTRYE